MSKVISKIITNGLNKDVYTILEQSLETKRYMLKRILASKSDPVAIEQCLDSMYVSGYKQCGSDIVKILQGSEL